LIKLRAPRIVTHFRINVDIHSDFTSLFAKFEAPASRMHSRMLPP
jgi:hypothetical protein